MATPEQIAQVRRMTALEPADPTYTDSLVGGMIDDLGMEGAVPQIWKEKAASAAGLVDITESGSSRSLGQLRQGYLDMAKATAPVVADTEAGRSFTVGVERV